MINRLLKQLKALCLFLSLLCASAHSAQWMVTDDFDFHFYPSLAIVLKTFHPELDGYWSHYRAGQYYSPRIAPVTKLDGPEASRVVALGDWAGQLGLGQLGVIIKNHDPDTSVEVEVSSPHFIRASKATYCLTQPYPHRLFPTLDMNEDALYALARNVIEPVTFKIKIGDVEELKTVNITFRPITVCPYAMVEQNPSPDVLTGKTYSHLKLSLSFMFTAYLDLEHKAIERFGRLYNRTSIRLKLDEINNKVDGGALISQQILVFLDAMNKEGIVIRDGGVRPACTPKVLSCSIRLAEDYMADTQLSPEEATLLLCGLLWTKNQVAGMALDKNFCYMYYNGTAQGSNTPPYGGFPPTKRYFIGDGGVYCNLAFVPAIQLPESASSIRLWEKAKQAYDSGRMESRNRLDPDYHTNLQRGYLRGTQIEDRSDQGMIPLRRPQKATQ